MEGKQRVFFTLDDGKYFLGRSDIIAWPDHTRDGVDGKVFLKDL